MGERAHPDSHPESTVRKCKYVILGVRSDGYVYVVKSTGRLLSEMELEYVCGSEFVYFPRVLLGM